MENWEYFQFRADPGEVELVSWQCSEKFDHHDQKEEPAKDEVRDGRSEIGGGENWSAEHCHPPEDWDLCDWEHSGSDVREHFDWDGRESWLGVDETDESDVRDERDERDEWGARAGATGSGDFDAEAGWHEVASFDVAAEEWVDWDGWEQPEEVARGELETAQVIPAACVNTDVPPYPSGDRACAGPFFPELLLAGAWVNTLDMPGNQRYHY